MRLSENTARLVQVVDSFVAGRTGTRVPVRDYIPFDGAVSAPLLWVHGGGFMTGGLDMNESDAVARWIAESGRAVRTVDYRLVPMVSFRGKVQLKQSDNRYPAPLNDVLDAYLDLVATTAAPSAFIGGASAGACLALSAELHRHRDGSRASGGLLLVYGTFHGRPAPMSAELRSRLRLRDRALGIALGDDSLERMNMNYGGSEASLDDHEIFPGGGDLHGLPPTFVVNADRDALRASGDAIAHELNTAGVEVTAETIPGTAHGFLNKPQSPSFTTGVKLLVEWLDNHDPSTPHPESTSNAN